MRCKLLPATLVTLALLLTGQRVSAQAYSTPPTLQAFQAGVTTATTLTLPYTIGIVQVGGAQQIIQPGSVALTDNMYACNAPQYAACNFIYWSGVGTGLLTTTSPQTAFAAGNAIVGFVTTTGGVIVNVVTFFQATELSDNLLPINVSPSNGGLRLPVCNALLKQGCQAPLGSLSGL